MTQRAVDVVIVGAGPNGLTAAIVLARSGLSVVVLEARETIGGGCRTESLTLPGYRHDVCAAIHPMGAASPIFQRLRLTDHGVAWLPARYALAHPLDDGRVALLSRRMDETTASLDGDDGARWAAMLEPFVDQSEAFFDEILRPVRIPRHIGLMSRFGLLGLQSSERVQRRFRGAAARALLAGSAAHSVIPLSAAGSAAFGLVLSVAGHALDWPCARAGSQSITDALATLAGDAGCRIVTNHRVASLHDIPPSRAVLFDVTPRQVERIVGDRFPPAFRNALCRFRYGAGVFKIDYALSAPIPWTNAACAEAATVHVGGTADEISRSEAAANRGVISDAPFVLVAQQSHMDASRAPAGRHTGWAYCHVPHGSPVDMTARIEQQIERFAPGFRDVVLARHVMDPRAIERHNANMIGGDIGGGANTLRQFLLRPTLRWNPYSTPDPRFFFCSSSTPPGGGVHGMCGYGAAATVLRRVFRRPMPDDLRV
ncbi:MAG: NAD(P)/FAD-dependent oxidoreductase [Acidobacteria bacterium]|nr:NAD(P)/FAD-dependent oxidoreductase [Acidobacteriota bacterium]